MFRLLIPKPFSSFYEVISRGKLQRTCLTFFLLCWWLTFPNWPFRNNKKLLNSEFQGFRKWLKKRTEGEKKLSFSDILRRTPSKGKVQSGGRLVPNTRGYLKRMNRFDYLLRKSNTKLQLNHKYSTHNQLYFFSHKCWMAATGILYCSQVVLPANFSYFFALRVASLH